MLKKGIERNTAALSIKRHLSASLNPSWSRPLQSWKEQPGSDPDIQKEKVLLWLFKSQRQNSKSKTAHPSHPASPCCTDDFDAKMPSIPIRSARERPVNVDTGKKLKLLLPLSSSSWYQGKVGKHFHTETLAHSLTRTQSERWPLEAENRCSKFWCSWCNYYFSHFFFLRSSPLLHVTPISSSLPPPPPLPLALIPLYSSPHSLSLSLTLLPPLSSPLTRLNSLQYF